jgi:ABC-type phosphate transport system substrate-binding protein
MRKYAVMCVLIGAGLLMSPLPSWAGVGHDPIVVIAHKSSGLTKVTRDDLRPIFQTRRNTWPDGSTARPFNLPEGSSIRQGFDAAVLGLDPDRVARYWIDRKIRGGERAPQVVPSDSLMVKVVSKTPGAVGYVAASAVDSSVTVVAKVIDGLVVAP